MADKKFATVGDCGFAEINWYKNFDWLRLWLWLFGGVGFNSGSAHTASIGSVIITLIAASKSNVWSPFAAAQTSTLQSVNNPSQKSLPIELQHDDFALMAFSHLVAVVVAIADPSGHGSSGSFIPQLVSVLSYWSLAMCYSFHIFHFS